MYYCNAFFYDIDIFGTSMQMSIGKREKLSTFAGSLISILVGITFICLFFFLGNGLFNKTNPRTSSSISESLTFSRVNMSEKNLTIAIKIQHDGIQDDIFGDIVYYNYMYGKTIIIKLQMSTDFLLNLLQLSLGIAAVRVLLKNITYLMELIYVFFILITIYLEEIQVVRNLRYINSI